MKIIYWVATPVAIAAAGLHAKKPCATMVTATSMLAITIIYSGTAPARIREQAEASYFVRRKVVEQKATESYKYYYFHDDGRGSKRSA